MNNKKQTKIKGLKMPAYGKFMENHSKVSEKMCNIGRPRGEKLQVDLRDVKDE